MTLTPVAATHSYMERVLALDLALLSGAAWRRDGGYRTSAIRRGKPGRIDEHILTLKEWVESLIVEVEPTKIAVENDTGRGLGARTLQSYHAVVRLVAAEAGIPFVYDQCAKSARRRAFGKCMDDKDEAQAVARPLLSIPDSKAIKAKGRLRLR